MRILNWVSVVGFSLLLGSAQAEPPNVNWLRQLGANGPGSTAIEALTAADGVYVTGYTSGAFAGQNSGPGSDGYIRKYDEIGDVIWTVQFSVASGAYEPNVIGADDSGAYVAGYRENAEGDADYFLRKHASADGALFWEVSLGPDAFFYRGGVGPGGFYLTGQSSAALPDEVGVPGSNNFLRKFSPDGDVLWTARFGSGQSEQDGFTADSNAVYVSSSRGGQDDVVLRRFDPDGNLLATASVGTTGDDSGRGLSSDGARLAVVGTTAGQFPGETKIGNGNNIFLALLDVDLSGPAWVRQFGTEFGSTGASGVVLSGGIIAVSGSTSSNLPGQTNPTPGQNDSFVRAYNTSGVELWTDQFGTTRNDSAVGIAELDGRLVIAGQLTDPFFEGDIIPGFGGPYVTTRDFNGAPLWTRQFDSSGSVNDVGLGVALADGVYVAGITEGIFPGEASQADVNGSQRRDLFLARYDAAGNRDWARQLGSDQNDEAAGVVVVGDDIYVAGTGYGTLNGADPLDGSDAILARSDAAGNVAWVRYLGASTPTRVTGLAVSGDELVLVGSESPDIFSGAESLLMRVGLDGTLLDTTTVLPTPSSRFRDVCVSNDGIFAVGTGGSSAFAQSGTATLVHFDITGTPVWTETFDVGVFGRGGGGEALGIACSDAGPIVAGYVVSGFALPDQSSNGGEDLFVRAYDPAGAIRWTRQLGTLLNDRAADVAVSGSTVFVVGETLGDLVGPNLGSSDGFTLKLSLADGSSDDGLQLGTDSGDVLTRVTTGSQGVAAVGTTAGVFPGESSSDQTDTQGRTDVVVVLFSGGNVPPVADAGPDQVVQCAAHGVANVVFDGGGSFDPNGDPLTFDWQLASETSSKALFKVSLSPGTHEATLTVNNGQASDSDTATAAVVDDLEPAVRATAKCSGGDDECLLKVRFKATDTCCAEVMTSAYLRTASCGDIPVYNGQQIELESDDGCEQNHEHRRLELEADVLGLVVEATDCSGNMTSVEVPIQYLNDHGHHNKKHYKKHWHKKVKNFIRWLKHKFGG